MLRSLPLADCCTRLQANDCHSAIPAAHLSHTRNKFQTLMGVFIETSPVVHHNAKISRCILQDLAVQPEQLFWLPEACIKNKVSEATPGAGDATKAHAPHCTAGQSIIGLSGQKSGLQAAFCLSRLMWGAHTFQSVRQSQQFLQACSPKTPSWSHALMTPVAVQAIRTASLRTADTSIV